MIILIRHGKAIDASEWNGSDKERPLTKEGRERTKKLAEGSLFLRKKLRSPLLYTSPYLRAYETAVIFADIWKLEVIKNDLFSPGWNATHLPQNFTSQNMIIVGHMPDLKDVLFSLTEEKATIDFHPPSLAVISGEKLHLVAYLSWRAFQ